MILRGCFKWRWERGKVRQSLPGDPRTRGSEKRIIMIKGVKIRWQKELNIIKAPPLRNQASGGFFSQNLTFLSGLPPSFQGVIIRKHVPLIMACTRFILRVAAVFFSSILIPLYFLHFGNNWSVVSITTLPSGKERREGGYKRPPHFFAAFLFFQPLLSLLTCNIFWVVSLIVITERMKAILFLVLVFLGLSMAAVMETRLVGKEQIAKIRCSLNPGLLFTYLF